MAHTRRTLTLNDKWDITANRSGGIALTRNALATAQAVANEVRLFTNDAYFIQDKGSPYFVIALGQRTNPAIVRNYFRKAALRVQDVKEVVQIIVDATDIATRTLTGDIQVITREDSQNVTINIDI